MKQRYRRRQAQSATISCRTPRPNVNELVFLKEILSTIPPIDSGRKPGVPARRVVTGPPPVQTGIESQAKTVVGTSHHGNTAPQPVAPRQADPAVSATDTSRNQPMREAASTIESIRATL